MSQLALGELRLYTTDYHQPHYLSISCAHSAGAVEERSV